MFSTSLLPVLREFYRSYGGWRALLRSEYFIIAIILSFAQWRNVGSEAWVDTTKVVLPALTAFTVAAFAILFAILNDIDREALSYPEKELDGRTPLLMIATPILHAALIQIAAITYAVVFSSKPFPVFFGLVETANVINVIFSWVGCLLMIYGILLLVGSVLSVYRIIGIKKSKKKLSTSSTDAASSPSTPVILDGEAQPPSSSGTALH